MDFMDHEILVKSTHMELENIWKLSSHSLQSYETQVVMTFIEWNTAQNASNLEGVF